MIFNFTSLSLLLNITEKLVLFGRVILINQELVSC